MATVFLARLGGVAGFSRLYAIKRLHPHLAHEKSFVEMFLDEARLVARIHHPNVVPVLEVGTTQQGYYLVMEYIEGVTAAHFMSRPPDGGAAIPHAAVVRITLDALGGLHAAHELTDDEGRALQIVHRDVSPQNILVGVDGAARITDFGVAHAATRLSSTRTGELKGKLSYMAPEQAQSSPVDRRVDVWAMGVVLWEMLTGARLFKGQSDAETLNRVLSAPISTPHETRRDVPESLSAVCMKALARDPAQRFATAAAFAEALESEARSLALLGTSRDLAAYVDGVIGKVMAQQRDMLRTWMSRAPSGHDFSGILAGPESPSAREPTLAEAPAAPRSNARPPRTPSVSGVKAVPLEAEPAVPRLLIVDDSATTRNLVRVYLMGLGFAFLEASRADTALSMLASSKVDLVIADVNMPVMGGLAFLRAIRALPDRAKRRVPVVLLTADRSPETRARGLAAGAAGFVLKPVTSSNLREAVTMLLRQADAQKSG